MPTLMPALPAAVHNEYFLMSCSPSAGPSVCRNGHACSFHHPPEAAVMRNHEGFPMRPGAEPCTFYLLNADCSFGAGCLKHHPNIALKGTAPGMSMHEYLRQYRNGTLGGGGSAGGHAGGYHDRGVAGGGHGQGGMSTEQGMYSSGGIPSAGMATGQPADMYAAPAMGGAGAGYAAMYSGGMPQQPQQQAGIGAAAMQPGSMGMMQPQPYQPVQYQQVQPQAQQFGSSGMMPQGGYVQMPQQPQQPGAMQQPQMLPAGAQQHQQPPQMHMHTAARPGVQQQPQQGQAAAQQQQSPQQPQQQQASAAAGVQDGSGPVPGLGQATNGYAQLPHPAGKDD